MKEKIFFIRGSQLNPNLAPGRGSCFATDLITVDGKKIGFMYRENPGDKVDSGWRFFAGAETQEYVDDPDNLSIYDINTIANYDPAIIPFLDAPAGSAFEKNPQTGHFVPVPFPHDPDAN